MPVPFSNLAAPNGLSPLAFAVWCIGAGIFIVLPLHLSLGVLTLGFIIGMASRFLYFLYLFFGLDLLDQFGGR